MKTLRGRDMYKIFLANGWEHRRTTGSHRIMRHTQTGQTFPFAFPDNETLGSKIISKIKSATGLTI